MPRSKSSEMFKSRKEVATIMTETDPIIFKMFEKPTQIYRYLKTRFMTSPLFLNRNLSYMKGRCLRPKKSRKDFSLQKFCERKIEENSRSTEDRRDNLLIALLCFNDEKLNSKNVIIRTKLEKVSQKRRKDGIMSQTNIGESIVIVNRDDNGTEKIPAVYVSNKEFGTVGENFQPYILIFEVQADPKKERDEEEPPNKIARVYKQYRAQLPLIDKFGRNLIANGLYEVPAHENHQIQPSRISGCFESIVRDPNIVNWAEEVNKYYFTEKEENPFNNFEKAPKIKLYTEWTNKETSNFINRPKFIKDQINNNTNNKENIPTTNGVDGLHKVETVAAIEQSKSYMFQFVVNSSIKQRTEERSDFMCPWCSLNCIRMYSLMKHLKLTHSRFLFQYIEEGDKARIDVYINENYDGSFNGAPHEVLLGQQRGPTRRNVVTYCMAFRPRRPNYQMNEFLEADDGELDQQRTYISGHNRIYYHSETCIPILPKELDYDSEGEPDPKWLQRTTKQMIDEFTDVNEGEKELMKLWNLHVMKHGFVGDCQMILACDLFVKEKGAELLEKNLFRNYLIHLDSLFDYGFISPRQMYENIQKLLKMQNELGNVEKIQKLRKMQVEFWIANNPKEEKAPAKSSLPALKGKGVTRSASDRHSSKHQ